MGRLIDVKPVASLLDIKPNTASVFEVKPNMGSMKRQTEDQKVVDLYAGMSIGPGFFMFLTYPVTQRIIIA